MDATTALVIVGVLVALAIAAAAGMFDRTRRARRTVVERPARAAVVEQPVVQQPVVQQPVVQQPVAQQPVQQPPVEEQPRRVVE